MVSCASDHTRRSALVLIALPIFISTKTKLLDTICVTILLVYRCVSWVTSGNMENNMNAFATSYYIKQLDCKSNERNYCTTSTQSLNSLSSVNCISLNTSLGCLMRSFAEDDPCILQIWQKEARVAEDRLPIQHTESS